MGWFLFVVFLLSLFLSIPISIEPGFILPSNNKNPKEKNNNQLKPFGGLLQPSLLLLLLFSLVIVCMCMCTIYQTEHKYNKKKYISISIKINSNTVQPDAKWKQTASPKLDRSKDSKCESRGKKAPNMRKEEKKK